MANAMAKAGRRANREKALRLVKGDPHKKVDASSWTPPEALNAGRKTGARPVQPRIYKIGGKVQGDRADRHPGKLRRASGGRTGTGPLSMANVRQENKDDFGAYHDGAYNKGGAAKDVHKHEAHMHKGEPKTKLATGGKAGGPSWEARKLYAKTYMKHAKTARDSDAAMSKAYAAVAAKHGNDMMNTLRDYHDDNAGGPLHYKGEGEKRGGRTAHASGGRTKGKTNIRIVINAGKGGDQTNPNQGVVRPPPPPPPPPQMPPPAAGGPPGGAPMGPPGGGMPPMARKAGGRTYRTPADMDAGSDSGLGRLEKTEIQKRRA